MILIADGKQSRREALAGLFKNQLGQVVIEVACAEAMRDWLSAEMPHLLLFDAGMDGLAEGLMSFLAGIRARAHQLQLPIVALLPRARVDLASRLFRAGCNDIISLPTDPKLVSARINNQLRLQRLWHSSCRSGPDREDDQDEETFHHLQPPHIYEDSAIGCPAYFPRPDHIMTLAEWIEAGNHVVEQHCLLLLRAVARTMACAHEAGCLVGRIDPDHTTLLPDGEVRLNDLGPHGDFSTAVSREPDSPLYAAPEQLRREEIDVRTDVYNYGSLAYTLFAGQAPFAGFSGSILLNHQIGTMVPSLIKCREEIGHEAAALISRCLNKKPTDRFQNMAEILAILDGLLLPEPMIEPHHHERLFEISEEERHTGHLIAQLLDADDEEAVPLFTQAIALAEDAIRGETLPKTLREMLSDVGITQRLLIRYLTPEHWHQLFAFFSLVAHQSVMPVITELFNDNEDRWYLDKLARLMVVCCNGNLQPLVALGLTLPDEKAAPLLHAFADLDEARLEPYLSQWADHPGEQTQMELLKQVAIGKTDQQVLERLTKSEHNSIREMAQALRTECGLD